MESSEDACGTQDLISTAQHDYVSAYVAFGSETAESLPLSSLDLSDRHSKEDTISQLRLQIEQLSAFQHQADSLTREVRETRRLNQELQQALRRLTRETQAKDAQLEAYHQASESLRAQLTSLESMNRALMEEVESRQDKARDYDSLRETMDEMMEQWKLERTQLLRELEAARGKMDDTIKFSPSKRSPRSKSQGKSKKAPSPRGGETKISIATQRRVLQEVTTLLGVQTGEVVGEVKGLLKHGKNAADSEELVQRICSVVEQFSPPGSFTHRPSLQQVWRWVERLIEEYLALRKVTSQSQALVQRLTAVLGNSQDIVREVELLKQLGAVASRQLGLEAGLSTQEMLIRLQSL
jgi:myosin heavy subunit